MALQKQPLFLGWHAGFLTRAAAWLVLKSGDTPGAYCDLSAMAIALPGRRAGRKLLELLVAECARSHLILIPPHIVSIGEIPELLYRPALPLASPSEELFAMSAVLSALDSEVADKLSTKNQFATDELRVLAVAKQLLALRAELGKAGVSCEKVIEVAQGSPDWEEEERWTALNQIYTQFEESLALRNRCDRDAARRAALEGDELLSRYQELVLIGCSELSPLLQRFIAQSDVRCVALVQAPEECAAGFCSDGSIVANYWNARTLTIPDPSVRIAESAHALAQSVIETLALLPQPLAVSTITIGIADETVRTLLTERCAQYGIMLRNSEGSLLVDSSPVTLLRSFLRIDYHYHYTALATFVRHPDAQEYLSRRYQQVNGEGAQEVVSSFVALLDRYYFEHLPASLSPNAPELPPQLTFLLGEVIALKAVLPTGKISAQKAAHSLIGFFARIYEDKKLSADLLAAGTQCKAVIEELAQIAPPTDAAGEELRTLASWSQLLLQRLGTERIPSAPALDALEELGWLELPLDDAPQLIVCGMHEGVVPEAITADPFLPHTLREKLGLLTNDARCARDRYAVEILLHSREQVLFLAAKESVNREPLMLSRVLLAGERDQVVARVAAFYESEKDTAAAHSYENGAPASAQNPAIVLPIPVDTLLATPTSLSISAFKDYLSCPYLFYLRHIKKLRVIDDRARELSPLLFGQLLHEVVARFSIGDYKNVSDTALIERELLSLLDLCAARHFGEKVQPAVKIQIEQLKKRVQSFAVLQASLVAQGWETLHTEFALGGTTGVSVEVDDQPVILKGRIDRIDRHRETGAFRIIDYKTGEGSPDPARALRAPRAESPGGWRDLQLPLYYGLFKVVAPEHADAPLTTSYIGLSSKSGPVKLLEAPWSEQEYEGGWHCMEECVRSIRAKQFSPSGERRPADEFSFVYGEL